MNQNIRNTDRTSWTTVGRRITRLAALALPLLAGTKAWGHQIWLEQDAKGGEGGKGGKLYFGEYAENLREASPGRLDKFVNLKATLSSSDGEKEIPLSKTSNGFAIGAVARKGESLLVQDTSYPVMNRKSAAMKSDTEKPTRTLWTPAARFVTDLRAQTPKLALDVVPAGKPGEFQVVFRGKPLPAAKVGLLAASGWGRDGETDQEGKVRFALPWKSGYLVKVNHVEAMPGKRKTATGEEAYDAASFSTTLSFVTPTGLTAPPASSPTQPRPETPMAAVKGH